MTLRNQKCTVYKSKITNAEPQKKASEFYKIFGIKCPLYIEQSNGKLIPVYHLEKPTQTDVETISEQDPSAAVRDLCERVFPAQQVLIADEHFYEKMIISLALDGTASEEGIQRILENNFQKHVSIGKISQILNQAASRAAEFDKTVDLSDIRQGANDEIFQCGNPVLTGVDADTGYAYLLQPAADRTADTWENAMNTCKSRNLEIDVSISDFGTGLLGGIPKAFPNACIQPDLFHFLWELGC